LIEEAVNSEAIEESTPTILAQVGAHEQVKGDDDCDCDCDLDLRSFKPKLTPNAKDCKPDDCDLEDCKLDKHNIADSSLHFEANQAADIKSRADTRVTHEEESACCSNEETTHESLEKACKYRHFCIKGDIVVSEKVTFKDVSIADEKSEGKAEKTCFAVNKEECGDEDKCKCYDIHVKTPLEIESEECEDETPLPDVCSIAKPCPTGYICILGKCFPKPGNECTGSGPCKIFDPQQGKDVSGTCRSKLCVPTVCTNSASCLHTSVLFCKKPSGPGNTGKPDTCLFKGEF